jgi:hypothetical protein
MPTRNTVHKEHARAQKAAERRERKQQRREERRRARQEAQGKNLPQLDEG